MRKDEQDFKNGHLKQKTSKNTHKYFRKILDILYDIRKGYLFWCVFTKLVYFRNFLKILPREFDPCSIDLGPFQLEFYKLFSHLHSTENQII